MSCLPPITCRWMWSTVWPAQSQRIESSETEFRHPCGESSRANANATGKASQGHQRQARKRKKLTAMLASVDDHAVASVGHAGSLCDLACSQHELAQNRGVAVLGLRRKTLELVQATAIQIAD